MSEQLTTTRPPSVARLHVTNFLSNRVGMLGLVICLGMLLASLLAPWLVGDPSQLNPTASRKPPSAEHWFGTDQLGRDIFAQVLHGGRVSIFIGVMASLVGTLIGTVLGALAGYFRGWLDTALVRFSEIIMTFPDLLLILIFVALLGPGISNLILVFALTGWMTIFRLVRSEFLSLSEDTFVEASRAFGYSTPRIIFGHMLPNALSPIVVAFTVNVAIYIVTEAGLSFLGLGVPITTPTWGNLLSAAQSVEVMRNYWWLWVFPAVAIVTFVAGINFIGDALRDVLDPRHRSSRRRKARS